MKYHKRMLHLMGTVIQITLHHKNAEVLLDEIARQLIDYQRRFSANDPNSDLMQLNQQAGIAAVKLDADLFELIKIGKEQSLSNNGPLNIAIGPLIQTWRIGFADVRYPAEKHITSLLSMIDPNNIILDEKTSSVLLCQSGMAIDLGALAKGYFADRIVDYLKQEGVLSAFIDLGGNVVVLGDMLDHADSDWRIGIQNPFLPRGHYMAVIKAKNQSIVTSGIYERKALLNNQSYHHIFDSKTGYPLKTDVASITIVSDRSIDGEIWTTQLYGKSPKQIILALNQMTGFEGLVVTTDGQFACSSGLRLVGSD